MQGEKIVSNFKDYIQKMKTKGGTSGDQKPKEAKGAKSSSMGGKTALLAGGLGLIALLGIGFLFQDDILSLIGMGPAPEVEQPLVSEPEQVATPHAQNNEAKQDANVFAANNGALHSRNMDRITELMADTEMKRLELENLRLVTELKKLNRDLSLIRTVTQPGYPGGGMPMPGMPGMNPDVAINPEFPNQPALPSIIPPGSKKEDKVEEEEDEDEEKSAPHLEPSGIVQAVYGKGRNLIAMIQTPTGKFRLKRGESVAAIGTIESITLDKVSVNFNGKSFILPWE